jgi:hypothetical protein
VATQPNKLAVLPRIAVSLWLAAITSCAYAQPASSPTSPSEAHERLAFFEGTWTTSNSTPEDDLRETCAWLAGGRRHMVCRSRWRTEGGHREGLSIFSYDSAAREYRYHGFRSGGAVVTQKAERQPNGWLFTSDQGAGADRVQSRVTIERTAEDRFSFQSESARGADPWQVGVKFEYVRIKR